jgi:sugar lactone lactonase YvrE
MSLSALAQGKLLRLTRNGHLSTLVAPVAEPGGQQVSGHFLYFNTHDIPSPKRIGTVDRLDLRTKRLTAWSKRLPMPNGLALLPNGDAVVTGSTPNSVGITRIPARHPRRPRSGWAKLADTNGVVVDPTGRWLYVDRDPPATSDGAVDRVLISDPRRIQRIGHLGPGSYPDDMTVDAKGILYVVGFASGKLYRLNPRTHASCAIASGLGNPTAAKFAGPGWKTGNLFVTSAQGTLYRLAPPASG